MTSREVGPAVSAAAAGRVVSFAVRRAAWVAAAFALWGCGTPGPTAPAAPAAPVAASVVAVAPAGAASAPRALGAAPAAAAVSPGPFRSFAEVVKGA